MASRVILGLVALALCASALRLGQAYSEPGILGIFTGLGIWAVALVALPFAVWLFFAKDAKVRRLLIGSVAFVCAAAVTLGTHAGASFIAYALYQKGAYHLAPMRTWSWQENHEGKGYQFSIRYPATMSVDPTYNEFIMDMGSPTSRGAQLSIKTTVPGETPDPRYTTGRECRSGPFRSLFVVEGYPISDELMSDVVSRMCPTLKIERFR